ncbi:nuclear elongation and deformation protein 1-like [Teratosphaeria destructans]|uniref:Nuclear elongation and deformation protein 1-like n=1 Tax=Teratosphaeria destructans TaxID=418781 RepID=A0A9W7SMC3_9PEZI|nr:nuclear elongation and deformation protein 1-like [Teratosphaeria destructans]
MQYVRSLGGTVSKTWNSINPATLSGAIDVIVVEQEDGSLACSPFHIRFGKFSLLRPYEKKVEFRVNAEKQDYPMKLGEGGEAFFVFETAGHVPEALQTSPPVSPASSPELRPESAPENLTDAPRLQEPEPFTLESQSAQEDRRRQHSKSTSEAIPIPYRGGNATSEIERLSPLAHHEPFERPGSADMATRRPPRPLSTTLERTATDSAIPAAKAALSSSFGGSEPFPSKERPATPLDQKPERSSSPGPEEAKARAMNLSRKLWTSNISNQVTDSGDLMLDMTGFKSSDGEALHAEVIARQLLSEEIDGPYDIGSLIGADAKGNVWIYSSEEAKEAANKKATAGPLGSYNPSGYASSDAISDPGYHSDDAKSETLATASYTSSHIRRDSDSAVGMISEPSSPGMSGATSGDPNKNYAKTLRLTSDQLKAMNLKSGANSMAFTVNRATCNATLWYWHHSVPIVISDIDGTITKSDVLGHVLTTLGRDWTHQGVAKLYTDISANGYNFLYLTSRSVGQADTTRAYLDGVIQDGYRLPKGPVILSPDRTIAALRREVYLRKPEIFKMACLRDIMALFSGHGGSNNVHENQEAGLHTAVHGLASGKGKGGSPFYAGFGNRLTDALSYRSVNIPSTRIFTINSNSEVSLDLLSLNKFKTAYGSMREIVDHYFPPVGLLVKGGGEEFTDFNYWRDRPLDIVDFTDSESESEAPSPLLTRTATAATSTRGNGSVMSEDEAGDEMLDSSYLSEPRISLDESVPESVADESELTQSQLLEDEEVDADDEDEEGEDEDYAQALPVEGAGPRTPEGGGVEGSGSQITPSNAGARGDGMGLGVRGVERRYDSDGVD